MIMNKLLDKEKGLLFETVYEDGIHPDTPEGRLINPGHVAESMWFVMDEALERNDNDLFDKAISVLLNILDFGWDKEQGGLYYFLDSENKPREALEWNMKLWWPQTEAMYALLLGYQQTKNKGLIKWYERFHEYSWNLFPDREYGAWYGYFDRFGNIVHDFKGSKFMSCFHLARFLLYSWRLL